MKLLNREAILAARDLPTKEVSVPEWGGSVFVRPLSISEAERLMKLDPKKDSYQVAVAAMAVCDKDGNSMFTEEDMAALATKSSTAIMRIGVAVQEISALSVKAAEQVKGN